MPSIQGYMSPTWEPQPHFASLIVLFCGHLSDILSDRVVKFCSNHSLSKSFRYQRNSPRRIRLQKRSVSTPNECLFFFFFGRVGFLLLCVGFLWLRQTGAALYCGAQASHYDVFSVFRSTSPRCVGFSSYGMSDQCLWLVGSRAPS